MSELDKIKNSIQRTITLESGKSYTIQILKGRTGMRIGTKLLKTAGPVMGKVADSLLAEDADLYGEDNKFEKVAEAIMGCLDDLEFDKLVDDLLAYAKVQEPDQLPRDLNIDEDFAANYGELVELLAFSIKENFGSLFTGKLTSRLFKGLTGKIEGLTGKE